MAMFHNVGNENANAEGQDSSQPASLRLPEQETSETKGRAPTTRVATITSQEYSNRKRRFDESEEDNGVSANKKQSKVKSIDKHGGIDSQEDVFVQLASDYFNRLLYQCEKAWKKHVKAIKKVEQLNHSRKISPLLKNQSPRKDISSNCSKGEELMKYQSDDDKTKTSQYTTDKERDIFSFEVLRDLSVDEIVQEAMKRLGIFSLNPTQQESMEERNRQSNEEDHHPTQRSQTTPKSSATSHNGEQTPITDIEQKEKLNWIEKILGKRRLIQLTEEWNLEITKYRQWYVRIQEQKSDRRPKKGKANEKKNPRNSFHSNKKGFNANRTTLDDNDDAAVAADREFLTYGQSLFHRLGKSRDGIIDSSGDDKDDSDGSDDSDAKYHAPQKKKKKNRPGQRARQQRHLQEQPQRSSRRNTGSGSHHGSTTTDATNSIKGEKRFDESLNRKINLDKMSDEKRPTHDVLHPSWAARKNQNKGIVKFQGSRITFDDDSD